MLNRSAGRVSGGNDGKVDKGSRGKITTFNYSKDQRDTRVVGKPSTYENGTEGGNLTQIKRQKFGPSGA